VIRIVALAIVGLALATAAHSTVTEVSPGHFECQSPSGRYERADGLALVPGGTIHARFRYRRNILNSRFAATAGLVFQGDPAPTELQVTSFNGRLSVEVRPLRATRSRFIGHGPLDEEVAVTAALGPDGTLTVTRGRRSVTIASRADSTLRVEVTCQSGSFEIDVETAPPSVTAAE
jgi:hypothetical protein